MKKWKQIISILAVGVLLIGSLPMISAEVYLEETTEESTLVKGVTYQHIKRLDDAGWQDIHVVRADLNEEHLKFKVLRDARGVSFLQDTLTSAQANDAVAAINADFFAAKRGAAGRGSPVGMEISDGELKSTSATAEAMNVLYQLKEDGALYLNNFSFDITVTAPNGVSEKVSALNKYDDMNGLVMYTDAWNSKSLGAYGAVQEIVVNAEGVVTDKRWDSEPADIPQGGCILTSNLTKNTFIDDNLQVGDKVTIDVVTTPDYQKIETAVGGGAIILAEGVVPSKFSHNISGYNPRSAVGIDETGKIITLIAVDGRRGDAKGMTQTQLGQLMRDLGCYSALNLDGGGSTLMAVKKDGVQQAANKPSDGSRRAVTNSIGIIADTPLSDLARIEIKTDDTNVFRNTSRWVWLEGYDKYGQKVELNTENIQWSVAEGNGSMQGDMYYPTETGNVFIKAVYGDFSATLALNVLDAPNRMKFTNEKVKIGTGETTMLWLCGWDSNGRKAEIYPKDTDLVIANPIADQNGNRVTAKSSGATVITANFGAVSANMALMVDGAETISIPENKQIADPQNKSAELTDGGFCFTVFGNTRTPAKLFDLFIMNRATTEMSENGSLHAFVGGETDASTLGNLAGNYFTAQSYQKFTHGNSTFITLDNSGGTISSGDFAQWSKFRYDMNTLAGGNAFIFLQKGNISSNETEVNEFHKIVEQAASAGKNVYVFYGGYKNENYMENGVRYIGTAGVFPSIGLKPPANNISYVKYVQVTVNGEEVSYEMRQILE